MILNIFLYDFSFRCVVSGCGKIALHVLEKLIAYGALPVTVSGMFLTVVVEPLELCHEMEYFSKIHTSSLNFPPIILF